MMKRKLWQSDRDIAKQPKLGLSWCRCDRKLMADTPKCSICGQRNEDRSSRRLKKYLAP